MTQQKPPNLKTLPIHELVEDYQLYPRSEVDGSTVEQFREALRAGAKFPPIRVCSKTLRIIDGFHRKTAYEREKATHALCALEDVSDDVDLFRRAAAANASHGRRYSVDDYATAVRLAKRLGLTREQISADLFLPLDRVEKLERISAGRGAPAPPERNVPKAGAGRSWWRSRWTPSRRSPGPLHCSGACARGTSTRSRRSCAPSWRSCRKNWGSS